MLRLEQLPEAARAQAAAEGRVKWEPNQFMERLIELRVSRPKDFEGLSPAAKLSLGHYEAGRRHAENREHRRTFVVGFPNYFPIFTS